MKVNPIVWETAMKLRGFIASEFLKYHGPTDSAAGKALVQMANERGYTNRDRAIPGSTLRSWMGGESSVPQWAVKTMICYILEKGFIPETDDQLDTLLAYLLVDTMDIDQSLNDIIGRIPLIKHLDASEVQLSISRIWHAKFS